jgi:hypothetical protein
MRREFRRIATEAGKNRAKKSPIGSKSAREAESIAAHLARCMKLRSTEKRKFVSVYMNEYRKYHAGVLRAFGLIPNAYLLMAVR